MRRLARNETQALIGRRLAGPDFFVLTPKAPDGAALRADARSGSRPAADSQSTRPPVGIPSPCVDAAGPDFGESGPAFSSSRLPATSSRRADKAGMEPPPSIPAADSEPGSSVSSSPKMPARQGPGAGACTAPPGACHGPDIEAGGAVILSHVLTPKASDGAALRADARSGLRPAAVTLSGDVAALLALVAAHDRVSPERAVARLICARAQEIGLGPLLDARDNHAVNAAARHESCDDGDLHGLPEFRRVAPTRFAV